MTSAPSFPAGGSTDRGWIWLVAWSALALSELAVLSSQYLNQDVAWYCYMARRWLDGARLYHDVVDTNPPLIVWLSVPPTWIAGVAGLPLPWVVIGYVSALVAASVCACATLLKRAWPEASAVESRVLITAVLFCALPLAGREFGQREHLALLLALPYIVAAAARLAGRPLPTRVATALGVSAGLGLAIKPHLLAVAVVVEAVLVVARRHLASIGRRETAAMAIVVMAYVVVVLVWFREYLDIAGMVGQIYGGLNPEPRQLLASPALRVWGLGLICIVAATLARQGRSLAMALMAGATGALIGGLWQLKGWYYHMYPALSLAVLSLVVTAVTAADRLSPTASRRLTTRSVALVLVLAMVTWGAREAWRTRTRPAVDTVTPLLEVARSIPPGAPIYVIGMLLLPGVPVLTYSGRPWSGRHNSLWFLPGLYRDELSSRESTFTFRRAEAMPPLERRLYDEIIGDLCAAPPAMLVVETVTHQGPGGRRPFDLLTYYRQDRRFARLFASYRPVTRTGAFTAYVRADDGAGCEAAGT